MYNDIYKNINKELNNINISIKYFVDNNNNYISFIDNYNNYTPITSHNINISLKKKSDEFKIPYENEDIIHNIDEYY